MPQDLQRALTYTLEMEAGTPAEDLLTRVAQVQAQLNRAIQRIQQLEHQLYGNPGDDLAYGYLGDDEHARPLLTSVPHDPDPTELVEDALPPDVGHLVTSYEARKAVDENREPIALCGQPQPWDQEVEHHDGPVCPSCLSTACPVLPGW